MQGASALAGLLLSPFIGSRTAAAEEGASGARQALLDAIKANKGDEEVIGALRELAKANPTPEPARSELLYGRWKLLWASSNSEVSIATRKLPVAGTSVQLVGEKGGVEAGRAANIIQIFGGAITAFLGAAAVPDPSAGDTVLIGPPFYLELKLGPLTIPIQNTQEEGERKSLLGAEQNSYVQLYMEGSGRPGDLRVSEVTLGDPAVAGKSIFVHERL